MVEMAARMEMLGTETAFEVLARANALAANTLQPHNYRSYAKYAQLGYWEYLLRSLLHLQVGRQ